MRQPLHQLKLLKSVFCVLCIVLCVLVKKFELGIIFRTDEVVACWLETIVSGSALTLWVGRADGPARQD